MKLRSEAELLASIAHNERLYEIARVWTGNESAGKDSGAYRKAAERDRHELAIVRREIADDRIRPLEGAALEKWRKNIVALGPGGGARRR